MGDFDTQIQAPTPPVPAGWEGILDPGETIVWQGRPDGAFRIKPSNIFGAVFGLFFAGFALFWMSMASQAGGFFWAFGLIHFSVGVGLAAAALFGNTWARRHTWYTLTDRRAILATDMPFRGRRLKSYPITSSSVLEYDHEIPATIWFAHETRSTNNGSRRVDIGFERIDEGQEVYRLLRDIQRNHA